MSPNSLLLVKMKPEDGTVQIVNTNLEGAYHFYLNYIFRMNRGVMKEESSSMPFPKCEFR